MSSQRIIRKHGGLKRIKVNNGGIIILTLRDGTIIEGTVDEIIEYLQKTQNETYIDASSGNYIKTNYNVNYSHVDSETIKKYMEL